jgi:hypothetical protein
VVCNNCAWYFLTFHHRISYSHGIYHCPNVILSKGRFSDCQIRIKIEAEAKDVVKTTASSLSKTNPLLQLFRKYSSAQAYRLKRKTTLASMVKKKL